MNDITHQKPNTETTSATAAEIRALAERHKVAYVETATDVLGHHITRLAGDDVELDDTQRLLIALERAGCISGREAVRLHLAYLHEARP
jgi:hypothetical protein